MRIAIIYWSESKLGSAAPATRPLPKVFEAFERLGINAEAVPYNDSALALMREHLSQFDAVLTWVNPIEGGRDRSILDSLLQELSRKGIFISANPDTILKLGTKEVLYQIRDTGCGSDTHLYRTFDEFKRNLPLRLGLGEARVIKQYRGHSGDGVWRVERATTSEQTVDGRSWVRAFHAKRGCYEEVMTLDEFFSRCRTYFDAHQGQGRVIDQIYQPRVTEGMVRCYLVQGKVEGFGRQEIVALHPAPAGRPPETAPAPTKRHYHPPTMPEFQRLKTLLEDKWLPEMLQLLNLSPSELPVLWDCDFLFGAQDATGQDTYVLCEINVSCVSPFPDSAADPMAKAVVKSVLEKKEKNKCRDSFI